MIEAVAGRHLGLLPVAALHALLAAEAAEEVLDPLDELRRVGDRQAHDLSGRPRSAAPGRRAWTTSWPSAVASSPTMRRAVSRMSASRAATARGLNQGFRNERYLRWSGGLMFVGMSLNAWFGSWGVIESAREDLGIAVHVAQSS